MGSLRGMAAGFSVLFLFGLPSQAGEPLIRSRDGRLQAFPLPEGQWCGEVVGLRLHGKSDLPRTSAAFMQKFLAGARAAVTAECSKATGIRVQLSDVSGVVYHAWASKAGSWTWREISESAGPDDAAWLEIATVEAQRLNLLAGASKPVFLPEADAAPARLSWRISNATIGLSIAEPMTGADSLLEEADAAASLVALACPSPEKSGRSIASHVAIRTVACEQAGKGFSWGLVEWQAGRQRFTLGLYANDINQSTRSNVIALADAYGRIVASDW